MNIEHKIIESAIYCQSKLKLDMAKNMNDTMAHLNTRIDMMEEASQASSAQLTSRFGAFAQKQESHHSDLIQGMSQIEEMKTRLAYNSKK